MNDTATVKPSQNQNLLAPACDAAHLDITDMCGTGENSDDNSNLYGDKSAAMNEGSAVSTTHSTAGFSSNSGRRRSELREFEMSDAASCESTVPRVIGLPPTLPGTLQV